MADTKLAERYRAYIAALNERPVGALEPFVNEAVVYNGERKSRAEYRGLIEDSIAAAPDLKFRIGLLVVEGDMVSAKLDFDCTPRGDFIGLQGDGRRVSFAEHVFYRFSEGKIAEVWSLIDRWTVAEQLGRAR